MLLSLNWLKDHVKLSSSVTPEKVAEKLNLHTVEVEDIIDGGERFKNVVVGKILEVNPHPNADRLRLAKVDVSPSASSGQANKKLDIVCGAPNIEPGQLVPVAMIGAVLPNGLEIKEAEVRGEKSEGMMCAEDELGLGSDHDGILILDKKAKVGQPFADYLGSSDIVFEVDNKSLSNRPDLWSHHGMARELSVLLKVELKGSSKIDLAKELKKAKADIDLKVEVKDPKLCPRYMALAISGIEIKDSPKWLQERLIAVGSRPINNIVDITNYVMLDLGQPLHAFDQSLVDKIVVRRAKKGEIMKTLDNEERKLDDTMLVIADSKKPIAIAGVMGGANSEVSDKTNTIILEAANFEPIITRKTANKLALRTDASTRFEKSLDPNLCEEAIMRVLELIKETCPKAYISSELVDEKDFQLNQGPIALSLNWLNEKIGEDVDAKRVVDTLEKLGFETKAKKSKDDIVFDVKIPTWRATKDVSIPEDLVEEVARVYGYNNIKVKMPLVEIEFPRFNEIRLLERKIKEVLSKGVSLNEVYNYSFVGEDQLTKLGINYESHVRLANPIASHQTMLRQSLAPNLFENIKLNQAKYEDINLFEIGSVYFDFSGDLKKDDKSNEKLPYQEKHLTLVVAGDKEEVFVKVKGGVEYLFNSFDIELEFDRSEAEIAWSDKNSVTSIKVAGKEIGTVAVLDEKVAQKVGVKKKVALAEIRLSEFSSLILAKGDKQYEEIPKFPAVIRDLAFVVDNKILYNDIRKEITNFDELVKEVELFDVYQGEKIGKGKKNLAFHITYQADRTMTGEEVDNLQKKLGKHLEKKFGAVIRDF